MKRFTGFDPVVLLAKLGDHYIPSKGEDREGRGGSGRMLESRKTLIESACLFALTLPLVFEFKLPDIGEGVAEGEILKWMVKEGDQIKEDQPLVEVMTDKVNVQIPAPKSGKVSRIVAKEGDIAKVGQTIMVMDDGSTGAATPATPQGSPSPAKAPPRAD
ncbi:MAG: biotin/lipoyl-containing protein [Nitrososphaerales archaeon]